MRRAKCSPCWMAYLSREPSDAREACKRNRINASALFLYEHARYQFPRQWMAEHMPDVITDDPGAVTGLADQVIKAADKAGIKSEEISGRVRGHPRGDAERRRRPLHTTIGIARLLRDVRSGTSANSGAAGVLARMIVDASPIALGRCHAFGKPPGFVAHSGLIGPIRPGWSLASLLTAAVFTLRPTRLN